MNQIIMWSMIELTENFLNIYFSTIDIVTQLTQNFRTP